MVHDRVGYDDALSMMEMVYDGVVLITRYMMTRCMITWSVLAWCMITV